MKEWWKTLLFGSVALIGIWFALPLILTPAARWLIRDDGHVPADVIIALGGSQRCQREHRAMELYQQGIARKIVVSGIPIVWGLHTGEAARQYLVRHGVPDDDIVVLPDAWNTRREAMQFGQLAAEQGWRSAILVTAAYHSRRAAYTFERDVAGITFYASPLPGHLSEWQPERWWTRRNTAWLTIREWLAWGNTLIRGLE
ncbi:MAG: YdcF family protein [Acidobacteriota bacterium]|nr:YdcF family protein [Blastocatellia bacterium]MDW8240538.1 YdcF family protein [Acidobacteriota bacterium]